MPRRRVAAKRPVLPDPVYADQMVTRFTNIVMKVAPFGVGAAVAATVGRLGLGVLVNLAQLLATFASHRPVQLALPVWVTMVLHRPLQRL